MKNRISRLAQKSNKSVIKKSLMPTRTPRAMCVNLWQLWSPARSCNAAGIGTQTSSREKPGPNHLRSGVRLARLWINKRD